VGFFLLQQLQLQEPKLQEEWQNGPEWLLQQQQLQLSEQDVEQWQVYVAAVVSSEMAKAKLGSGARFAALKSKIAKKGGVSDPGAVAASIGRKKYGKERFQKLAAKGKKEG
jgi:hypothetical protein